MSAIEFAVKEKVGYITLNRPDQYNAMDDEMITGVYNSLVEIDKNEDIWIGVIKANGKHFSSGHDLKKIASGNKGPTAYDLYNYLLKINKPIIAALHGYCLAQGAGVALNSDIQIAADDTYFGWPQVKRGIASVSGPTILARRIPLNKAFEILFTGEFIDAAKALELGLVNKVVPREDLEAETKKMVDSILENAPLSVRTMKETTLTTLDMPQEEAYKKAVEMFMHLAGTEDAREGLMAFAEKRKPVWKGK